MDIFGFLVNFTTVDYYVTQYGCALGRGKSWFESLIPIGHFASYIYIGYLVSGFLFSKCDEAWIHTGTNMERLEFKVNS